MARLIRAGKASRSRLPQSPTITLVWLVSQGERNHEEFACQPSHFWILKGVFDTIPREVLDAAVVDGCTDFSAIWHIVLPLSAPGLVAVAVVSFFSAWNEFLYAGIMLGNAQLMPASVGLSTLKAIASTPVEQYMAAGLVFSILPVLFYLSMQRYIVSGLTAGAVKG
jgi:multiple sugar transport system permease protein